MKPSHHLTDLRFSSSYTLFIISPLYASVGFSFTHQMYILFVFIFLTKKDCTETQHHTCITWWKLQIPPGACVHPSPKHHHLSGKLAFGSLFPCIATTRGASERSYDASVEEVCADCNTACLMKNEQNQDSIMVKVFCNLSEARFGVFRSCTTRLRAERTYDE